MTEELLKEVFGMVLSLHPGAEMCEACIRLHYTYKTFSVSVIISIADISFEGINLDVEFLWLIDNKLLISHNTHKEAQDLDFIARHYELSGVLAIEEIADDVCCPVYWDNIFIPVWRGRFLDKMNMRQLFRIQHVFDQIGGLVVEVMYYRKDPGPEVVLAKLCLQTVH